MPAEMTNASHFVRPDVVADEGRAQLVLLDRAQHAAERRMHEPPQRDEHEREQREREIEHRFVAAQQRSGRADVEQAVLAAGDRMPLHRHEPEHLAEGDGQQRVVDAAAVRDERGDQRTGERRRHHRPEQAERDAGVDAQLQQSVGVGADAEVSAVTERWQPAMPEQQVVPEREQHPDHDLQGEVLVQPDGVEPQRRAGEQRDGEHHRRGDERGAAVVSEHGQNRMYVLFCR